MTRVAAVDLGSNSTRLLIADVDGGRLVEIERRLTITRLGEGVDVSGRLSPQAVARVVDVLSGFRDEAAALGVERTLATATSAVRDAANGREFLNELRDETGFEPRLLDGREEAEMTFRGVLSDRPVVEQDTLVLDIGGGSTELTLGGPDGIAFTTSLQAGCVRMTERFLHTDPPQADELEACARHVRTLLPALAPRGAIGVAGTVTTVAAIDLDLAEYDPERSHGHRISAGVVSALVDRLAQLPLAARELVRGLEPARAPVIVAGLVILREVLDAYRLEEMEVSERDILHGAALLAADTGAAP